MLNGRQASGRDVNVRIAELNIQVSNLWYGAYILLLREADPPVVPSFLKTEFRNSLA